MLETIDKFNKCYYCYKDNRRGVGFDKPQLEEEGPTCGCVSNLSFGHTGFTGTMTWADPEEEIVYVFLANRTYPEAGKNRLLRENIRTEMQGLIYEAIIDENASTDTNFAAKLTAQQHIHENCYCMLSNLWWKWSSSHGIGS